VQSAFSFRDHITVSKTARILHLSEQRVRQLFDAGEIPGDRDSDGRRYCRRDAVQVLALRRQVHQLMTGARKRGPKGPPARPRDRVSALRRVRAGI
jgi:hypothetical protein